jgi:hypothetical protein
MRKTAIVVSCIAALAMTLTTTCQADLLTNGSFENFGQGWTFSGAWMYAGGAPDNPDGNTVLLGGGSQYDQVLDCTASQNVSLASGYYTADLSFWYELLSASGSYNVWLKNSALFALTADGVDVATVEFQGVDPPHYTNWEQQTMSWTGYVNSTLGVRMVLSPGYLQYASNESYYPVAVDGMQLNAVAVPEPGTLALLATAALALAATLIRKRIA